MSSRMHSRPVRRTDHAGQPPPLPIFLARALERTLGDVPRVVLAVSGGLDSMVLLHAVARWRRPDMHVVVATFDHGTGPAATDAVRLVREEAAGLGLSVATGRTRVSRRSEEAWRRVRWRFLRDVAEGERAVVATAHTRDDQVETVAMRILRGAGARGLAGLAAPSPIRRPWLTLSRSELARWADAEGLRHSVDPTNLSRAHLRNRVRLDLLPALERTPSGRGLRDELVEIGQRAAQWRREVDRVVAPLVSVSRSPHPGCISVAREHLRGYSDDELAVIWPALAARAGVRLDRRGTRRLATFTSSAGRVARVPLSGGAEVLVTPHDFICCRRALPDTEGAKQERPLVSGLTVAGFRFTPGGDASRDLWRAALPAGDGGRLTVRSWSHGDRIVRAGSETARRVKRYFKDAGIPGPLRTGWPVVLLDGVIVWIPGVCRSDAATERPGRPTVTYLCERTHR